jgi:hypothetical protein
MRGLAIGLALSLGACARPSPPGSGTDSLPSPDAGDSATITLERQPCFGTCPVYIVAVERTGAVRFEGRRFVADSGVHTATVPAARVDSLLRELDDAGYFGLDERYRAGEPGCGAYATDLPTVIVQVRIGERSKRVEHDHGCASAPDALSVLERRIDEVAGVQRWVGRTGD